MNNVSAIVGELKPVKEIYKNSSQEPGRTPKYGSRELGARLEHKLVKEISKNGSQEPEPDQSQEQVTSEKKARYPTLVRAIQMLIFPIL